MSKQNPKSFFSMLVRSHDNIKHDRAVRIASGAERAQQRIVMQLQEERDAIVETLEALMDLSSTNDKNRLNVVDTFDAAGWTQQLQDNSVELDIVNRKLAIAEENYEKLFIDEDMADPSDQAEQGLKASTKKK